MVVNQLEPSFHPLAEYIYRLEQGEALIKNSPNNVLEVVGILKSYGMILDIYSRNLIYIAEKQLFIIFPFFKYFNGEISFQKLFHHWGHARINFEYAEYCMKSMMWHGGGELDRYLDTLEFKKTVQRIIQAKLKNNFLMLALDKVFPQFFPEQIRMMAYHIALGQFWQVMAGIFLSLSESYDKDKIKSISQVVKHISDKLVENANKPIIYQVIIFNKSYDIIPKSVGLTFLSDTAVPYIEAIFLRGTPFLGTISYNAQAYQIPQEQSLFTYGALYADPLSVGCAGIPPTLLMQDMIHYLPNYLYQFYQKSVRQEDDLLVKICNTFQKSMFCVMTAAIKELAPHSLNTTKVEQKKENRVYLEAWMDRLLTSRLVIANQELEP
ncbi:CO2 hydration protein [Cyanobacterium sp. uoEpiScrs1]|uniref:CO2 hydration protein n=1 Tax=Cyanobacterium sp. uoEpiScrs1 TaxID=2976343 RepID=UPI002269F800|nr:CO2 hydration protein [Cyanobacterium sp. uoEpiScrs1]